MATTVLPEWIIWVMAVSSVLSPFILLLINKSTENRRKLMEGIDGQIKSLKGDLESVRREVIGGRDECREDIQAVLSQLAEYPRRNEVDGKVRDAREEVFRYINRRPDDSRR